MLNVLTYTAIGLSLISIQKYSYPELNQSKFSSHLSLTTASIRGHKMLSSTYG